MATANGTEPIAPGAPRTHPTHAWPPDTTYVSLYGDVLVHGEDLPACCRRTAYLCDVRPGEGFECPVCGALWVASTPGDGGGCDHR